MRDRLRRSKELHLERMFETRSEAWERVGLDLTVNQRVVRRSRIEIALLVPVLIAALVLYHHRAEIFGRSTAQHYSAWIQWGTVAVLLVVGWTLARDIGRAAGPTMFRRMDPGMAGTVGFIMRLSAGIRPSQVQSILDQEVSTPTRSSPNVLLEEIDGDEVVVRVQAIPERADQGAELADQVIAALATVTGEHEVPRGGYDGAA